jgi:hypothetical protein
MPLPPKPKGQPEDLHEVERALSVLQGRHPEHERARREDEEKRKTRAAALDAVANAANTQTRARNLRLAAVAVPVALLLGFFALLANREMGRRERADKALEPFRPFGFMSIETSSPSATGTLETTADPGCFLAVATKSVSVKVTRGTASESGMTPALFCTCANERIALSADVGGNGSMSLLRTEAASIGGSRAFPFAPFKPGSTLRTDDGCSDASLDAWIDAKHYPAPPADGPSFSAWPPRPALVDAGFKPVAFAPATAPFVVVEVPKESCLVAASSNAADRLTLRPKGGPVVVPATAGILARCAQAEGTVVIAREGKGDVSVMVAPAAGLGGMSGLQELARESSFALASTVLAAADRAWDAKQLLLASQIPDANITMASAPEIPVETEPRVAALSFETPNALIPETGADIYSYCSPPLDANVRVATCVFSGPQKWRTDTGAESVAGIARAKLPFWLFAMQTASDPVALKGMTQLFALARRLTRDRFTPTTLEALTELPGGVEVLGRTGEDAIVAVGVIPTEPYVYTLSDGAPWTLEGAPRVVPVKPLQKIMLTSTLKTLPPKPARHTVVFRRTKH